MEDSAQLIGRAASAITRKLTRWGFHSQSRDDIEQELWIAWCRARDTFDPTLGVPFAAYLTRGLREWNKTINRKAFKRSDDEFADSLDRPIGAGDEPNAFTLGDSIPSAHPGPEEAFIEQDVLKVAMTKLSPRAAQFVKLLSEQPTELLEGTLHLRARAEHGRSMNISSPTTNHVTTALVFKLMGAKRAERTVILAEVKSLGDMMIQRNMH